MIIYTSTYDSPVGKLTLAAKEDALTGLWIEGQKYYPGTLREEARENRELSIFISAEKWLDSYFAGEKPKISDIKLSPAGSEFARSVWKILCDIPYGETMTYGEIARMITAQRNGRRMSAQAVGGAVAHNPISIIIPCHRVVGSNGSLTGYAGGIDKKRKLLTHEKSQV